MTATIFYPWAYLVTIVALFGWTLFSDRKSIASSFRNLFLFGFLAWMGTLLTAEGTAAFKLSVAFRDLMVMGIGSILLTQAKSNKIIGIATFLLAGIFLKQYYMPVLKSTFKIDQNLLDANGELLMDLGKGDHTALDLLLEKYQATMTPAFMPKETSITDLDDYFIIDIADTRRVAEIKKDLSDLQIVDWVEDNEMLRIEPIETEPDITRSKANPYGVNDPEASRQWAFSALDIPRLHRILAARNVLIKKKVVVAVVDTGVDSKHEDLEKNYLSTKSSYDRDVVGHGTHVAGIVAAITNNGLGVASMMPSNSPIKITSIKVLNDMGFGSQATIIKGMLLAADQGVDVISMSLGGPSSDKKQEAYRRAVEYCNKKGSIVVVAAGNANINAKTYAPANTPGVITVSAINEKLEKAFFSNEVQDLERGIAAPGEDIHSTYPKNQYRSLKGTSMAAPYVSSLIGILKTIDPTLTTSQVYELLSSTGKNSTNPEKTGKIIQPAPAVERLIALGTI